MTIGSRLFFLLPIVGLSAFAGCAVPQPRGQGQYRLMQEPATKTWYHLYLPVDYVRNQGQHPDLNIKRWPLVMTFHGMKPYDNALPQEREWEQEADNYGYIVCAPQLETSDSFMEYPLTKEHSYVLRDKRNVIAVMDHVFATTLADPKRVLSTSWSCGGYLAHYFPNRFPDRFSCIATRLSNFSSKLMIEETVPQYKDRVAVAVFLGDSDFPACKYESEEAVAWYKARRFKVAVGKTIDNMGHSRIPQTAAAFFAEQLNIKPLRPVEAARTLAYVQMTDYLPPPSLIAKMTPPAFPMNNALASRDSPRSGRTSAGSPVQAGLPPAPSRNQGNPYVATSSGRNYPAGQTPVYDSTPERKETGVPPSRSSAEPKSLPPSTPPSGARATQVAQASPRSSNWLAPPSAAPASASPAQDARPKDSERRRDAASIEKASPAPKPPDRQFSPQDAGSRRYDVEQARRELPPKSPPPTKPPQTAVARAPLSSPPVMLTDAGTSASPAPVSAKKPSSPHAPRPQAPPSKNRPVTIKLSGPLIGRAPHWIGFNVDLPRSVTQGADVLWFDNGVWMSDDVSGVKILEAPGRHEITVLLVAKNNDEYRGSAVVEVLEPFPSSRGSSM